MIIAKPRIFRKLDSRTGQFYWSCTEMPRNQVLESNAEYAVQYEKARYWYWAAADYAFHRTMNERNKPIISLWPQPFGPI